jgi:hypothetical protein
MGRGVGVRAYDEQSLSFRFFLDERFKRCPYETERQYSWKKLRAFTEIRSSIEG